MVSRESPIVLVVDDDQGALETLGVIIGHSNRRVLTASGYYMAVDKLIQYPVDLLITDCDMPGPSGILLTQKARDLQGVGFPVIAMSARMEREDEALLAGAMFFVEKPVQPEIMLTLIDNALMPYPLSVRSVG